VTDKGVPAALMMACTRSILHAAAADFTSPGQILARANDLLVPDMPPRMFVTCQYLVLEPASGRITLANAGHPLPLHRTSAEVAELRVTGMPLGLMPGMIYEECSMAIAPGEQLLLVSDGIIEAHAPDGEMFGVPRLRSLVEKLPPDAPLEAFCAAKTTFSGPEREQEDDVTLFRLARLGD
jgi:serine phosphatase RsbU (regulator of sigma subunit)